MYGTHNIGRVWKIEIKSNSENKKENLKGRFEGQVSVGESGCDGGKVPNTKNQVRRSFLFCERQHNFCAIPQRVSSRLNFN